MQLFLQLSKLQGTTSYFDENVGRVGVKSDTVRPVQKIPLILMHCPHLSKISHYKLLFSFLIP